MKKKKLQKRITTFKNDKTDDKYIIVFLKQQLKIFTDKKTISLKTTN
jgi:hypothetical protein